MTTHTFSGASLLLHWSTVSSCDMFAFNLREDLCETDYKTFQFSQMDLNHKCALSTSYKIFGFLKLLFCLKYFEEFVECSRILEPSRKMFKFIWSSSFLPHVMSLYSPPPDLATIYNKSKKPLWHSFKQAA